jgi:predicted nucleotidyltransferase
MKNLIPLKENPEEIIQIVVQKLKKKYGNKLLFVGGKGSLATGKFTPLSDIDLVVAVTECKENYVEFIYGTTYIDIRVATLKTLKNDLKKIDMYWPLRAGGILNLKIYYDKNKSFAKLKKVYQELIKNKKKFENAAELNAFIEYYSKSYRAFNDKNYKLLYWASFELFHQFSFILALLNQEYIISQDPIRLINQIKKFKNKPRGWESAVRLSMDRNPKKIFEGIQKMWKILNQLRKKYDFKSYDINNPNQIKF